MWNRSIWCFFQLWIEHNWKKPAKVVLAVFFVIHIFFLLLYLLVVEYIYWLEIWKTVKNEHRSEQWAFVRNSKYSKRNLSNKKYRKKLNIFYVSLKIIFCCPFTVQTIDESISYRRVTILKRWEKVWLPIFIVYSSHLYYLHRSIIRNLYMVKLNRSLFSFIYLEYPKIVFPAICLFKSGIKFL